MKSFGTRATGPSIDEQGFTLIELMTVVLIIAVLIAIAIPTFLGTRSRASNRVTQTVLRNTLTAAKTAFSDADEYPPNATLVGPAGTLHGVDPSLNYVDDATDVAGLTTDDVSVGTDASQTTFVAAGWAKESGTCFFIADASPSGTFYNQVVGGVCNASSAPAGVTTWPRSWSP